MLYAESLQWKNGGIGKNIPYLPKLCIVASYHYAANAMQFVTNHSHLMMMIFITVVVIIMVV